MSNYYQPTSNVSLLKQLFGTTYAFDSNANEFKTKINLALPGDLAIGSADTSYNLYVNGNAVTTSFTISQALAAGVAKWAEYPAVRYVDLAGFDIINASNIVTTNISTDTINGLPVVDSSGGGNDARLVITAQDSIYIGLSAGSNDGTALRSVGIGYNAAFNSTGDGVVALGNGAALSNIANNVVALGTYSAIQNQGTNVCAIGSNAGIANTGQSVIAIGLNAGGYNTGNHVAFIGNSTATSNSGTNVIAIGRNTADRNSACNVNCLGSNAGIDNTGQNLNAFGGRAGTENTGLNVNALGLDAGYRNSGNEVSAIGSNAASSNIGNNVFAALGNAAYQNEGSNICAIGFNAGSGNLGHHLVAIGSNAGFGNSGENVVFMGNDAGSNNSGSNVIAFGTRAANANSGSNCIFIGQDAGGENGLDNQLVISNLITGDFSSGEVTISNINVTNINGAPYGGGGATVGIHAVKDISDIMSFPAAPILWTGSIWSNGMGLSGDQVFASQSGTYRVDYEMLIEANNSPLIATWLRKGETDIDGTTTLTRNDAGNILQPTNTSVVNLSAGDSIDVMLCTADASMDAVFLFVEPNIVPGCPSGYSARMTITKLA